MFYIIWLSSGFLLSILLIKKQDKWDLDFWDYFILCLLSNTLWLGLSVIYTLVSA